MRAIRAPACSSSESFLHFLTFLGYTAYVVQPNIKIQESENTPQAQAEKGFVQPLHDQDSDATKAPHIIDNPLQQFEFDNDATVGTPEPTIVPPKSHHGLTIGIAASLSILFVSGTFAAYILL